MAITDPFFSGDNQTCTYTHEDLSRLANVNCGTPWSQTFSYDAFGNINKSGTMSFQPTYSYVTNHMTMIGSSTPTYDLNGNVTNDFVHTYTWNAAGRPITIDGVIVTYDALGRMVERSKSGVVTEVVYAPDGAKLAIMSGMSLQKAFVYLPGGSTAVYNSSGLAFYRHPDWLGSSRFASTTTRTMYSDGAYGPFGEGYAQTGTTDNLDALFGDDASVDPNDPTIEGGHANFSYSCDDLSICGPGRYDNGVHVECLSGGSNCAAGSPLVAHDDTVSPWISPFPFSNFNIGNFLEHGFVDLISASVCGCVFSQ